MYALVGFSEPNYCPYVGPSYKRRGHLPHKERSTSKREGPPQKNFATLLCRNIKEYITKRRRGGTEEL